MKKYLVLLVFSFISSFLTSNAHAQKLILQGNISKYMKVIGGAFFQAERNSFWLGCSKIDLTRFSSPPKGWLQEIPAVETNGMYRLEYDMDWSPDLLDMCKYRMKALSLHVVSEMVDEPADVEIIFNKNSKKKALNLGGISEIVCRTYGEAPSRTYTGTPAGIRCDVERVFIQNRKREGSDLIFKVDFVEASERQVF